MPRIRVRKNLRRRPKRMMRKRGPVRSLRATNPAPVFTETYTLTSLTPNAGGVFKFSMDQVPQLAQYTNLYQKYRILRASIHLLPEFNSFDQNQAENNVALSRSSFGLSRIAWSINDTPNVAGPVNELAVLQDNGSRVRAIGTNGVRMSCRPVPNVSDATGVEMTFKNKYINFEASAPNAAHTGISYWLTQLATGTPGTENVAIVYVKLTFQLADPR